MTRFDLVDLEVKLLEAKALLNTIRLAVERIDSENLNESGICECIDMLERLRNEHHEFFNAITKDVKVN